MKAVLNSYLVAPDSINMGDYEPRRRDVATMKIVLCAQGQIEPMLLDSKLMCPSVHGSYYAPAMVLAAIELGWPTLLVCY